MFLTCYGAEETQIQREDDGDNDLTVLGFIPETVNCGHSVGPEDFVAEEPDNARRENLAKPSLHCPK